MDGASPVVAVIGDGALLACLAALPTAAAENIDLVWLVLDNGGYASIAAYQAKHFGRFLGTKFADSGGKPFDFDCVALARSFGVTACRVTAAGDIRLRGWYTPKCWATAWRMPTPLTRTASGGSTDRSWCNSHAGSNGGPPAWLIASTDP